MKYLLASLFFFLLPKTYAGIGGPGSISDKGPDSICRIIMKSDAGYSICSGSLVKENKILTAAHCVENLKPNATILVQCGYQGLSNSPITEVITKGGNRLILDPIQFKETAYGTKYAMHPNYIVGKEFFDVAVIDLDRKLKSEPIKVITTPSKTDDLVCYAAGFGLNKNATTGLLNVGLINSKQLQESSFTTTEEFFNIFMNNTIEEDQDVLEISTYFRYYKSETLKYSVVSYGDSGGPVYCRPNTEAFTDADYFQISVNRAMYYSRKKLADSLYQVQYMSAYSEMTSSFIETSLAD